MLSAQDLAGMRETLLESLPDTCTLKRQGSATSDGAGGQTYGAPTSTVYPCRITPRLATGTGQLKDAETIEGDRLIAQAPWMITISALVELDAQDQIIAGDGRQFEVFAVLASRTWELCTRILCRLVNEGAG